MISARATRRAGLLAAAGSVLAATALGSVTALAAPGSPPGADPNTDTTASAGSTPDRAIVQLSRAPLAVQPEVRSQRGPGIDLDAPAVRNERARLAQQRNQFRQWLRAEAPQVKVTGQYDVAVNAVAVKLNGASLQTLRQAPGVASASLQATYTPTQDPDLALINGEQAWAAAQPPGGPTNAGAGVQIGIVDTGIDVTHPCFDDSGFPATEQLGDADFTNNKVIVAKVFTNKKGYTPEAVQDHGTHVAGTAACNAKTPAQVNGADIPYDPSGVAPGAQLGNYNVFPGDIASARSEDILNALEAAAEDGMDVINMSLGGSASGKQDLLTVAVNNLDRAGIVVAVSAGNDGPGHFTVGSPGSAERALTAGASTVGHFAGVPVLAGGSQVAGAAVGDFEVSKDFSGTLVASAGDPLGEGCVDGTYADASGAVALVSRGSCSFSTKVAMAEKAGAVGVIVVNNVGGDPIAMAEDGVTATTIPAVMVGLDALQTMVGLVGQQVTVEADTAYIRSGNDNIMAGFSSQGPTDVDFRVKPDVVAPGANVLSSLPAAFCDPAPEGCWGFKQGTSMSSPHLAGIAAVVRQANPDWTAEQVRSAIVNTAAEGDLTQATAPDEVETDPLVTGAGMADALAAVEASVALSQVSTSFGAVPVRSQAPLEQTITVTNLTDSALTLPVSVEGNQAFAASTTQLAIEAGGSAELTVSFTPSAGVPGDNSATLRLGEAAHAVLYAFGK